MKEKIIKYLNINTSAATLAFFRLAFGLMMLLSLLRFISYNWVEKFYIAPIFHFSYYGFGWVKPFGTATYLLFAIAIIASICLAIGYKYKLATIAFFLSFTYIELMDKTTYLNHYYFISIVSFVLIFLPANAYFSFDAFRNPKIAFQKIPRWTTDILKVLLGIVYFYAGLAKLNSDWLFKAMPLKIWLPTNDSLPFLSTFFNQNWVHFAFSWSGMFYDLTIPFLLLYKRTRLFAFALVVVFHVLTKILFPIGVFPYVMIVSTLVFFGSDFHQKVIDCIVKILHLKPTLFQNKEEEIKTGFNVIYKAKVAFLTLFLLFQFAFPFRYLLYANELFWTEEGFRFSWRVMLMEKAGYTQFTVTDSKTKNQIRVNNAQFLTTFQEKQMAFQPDFILEYAHFLHQYYQKQGIHDPEVRVESYVALNGRLNKPYIDPNINLAKEYESFQPKTWILPFNDEINGF